jgi:hypothetical protein
VSESNAIAKRGLDPIARVVFGTEQHRRQTVGTEVRGEKLPNIPSI